MQLVEQLWQMRRERGFRTQVLLQAFSDRVANRLAGLVIDFLEIAVNSAFMAGLMTGSAPQLSRALKDLMRNQVMTADFVSGAWLHALACR